MGGLLKWCGLFLLTAQSAVACGTAENEADDTQGSGGASSGSGGRSPGSGGSSDAGTSAQAGAGNATADNASGGKTTGSGGSSDAGTSAQAGAGAANGGSGVGGDCGIDVGGVFGKGGRGSTDSANGENAGAGGDGDGSFGDVSSTYWDVDLTDLAPAAGPAVQRFSMWLRPRGAQVEVTTSCAAGDRSQLVEAPRVGVDSLAPLRVACDDNEISTTDLVWRGIDLNADGSIDALEGSGTGSQRVGAFHENDMQFRQFPIEIRARPDTTQPSLRPTRVFNPLDSIDLGANELMRPGATLRLTSGDDVLDVPATPRLSDTEPVMGFHLPWVMPFGTVWNLSLSGKDLTGLPALSGGSTLRISDDPGILAEDGFENAASRANPKVFPSARFANGVSSPPPIAGNWSLQIGYDSSATLHLARRSCKNRLRFSARVFYGTYYGYSPPMSIVYGVVGGGHHSVTVPGGAATPVSGGYTALAPGHFDEPLLEPGGDVVLTVTVSRCYNSACVPYTILLDDVRIE